jgi:hypothetical protein
VPLINYFLILIFILFTFILQFLLLILTFSKPFNKTFRSIVLLIFILIDNKIRLCLYPFSMILNKQCAFVNDIITLRIR